MICQTTREDMWGTMQCKANLSLANAIISGSKKSLLFRLKVEKCACLWRLLFDGIYSTARIRIAITIGRQIFQRTPGKLLHFLFMLAPGYFSKSKVTYLALRRHCPAISVCPVGSVFHTDIVVNLVGRSPLSLAPN